jgi:hypothetical protein
MMMTGEIDDGQRNALTDIVNDRTRSARIDAADGCSLASHLRIRKRVIRLRCAF